MISSFPGSTIVLIFSWSLYGFFRTSLLSLNSLNIYVFTFSWVRCRFSFWNFRPNELPNSHSLLCWGGSRYKPTQVAIRIKLAFWDSCVRDPKTFCTRTSRDLTASIFLMLFFRQSICKKCHYQFACQSSQFLRMPHIYQHLSLAVRGSGLKSCDQSLNSHIYIHIPFLPFLPLQLRWSI